MKHVIIVGSGGHSKVVADIVKLCGDIVVGYLDDNPLQNKNGINVLGTTEDIGKDKECFYFVAIGNCETRCRLMQAKAKYYTAIHPSAVIASDVKIEEGTCVMANVVVNSGTKISRGVIINTAATVDHDCQISEFVHIAPGVHISGTVSIGKLTWVGAGAIISNNISICSKSIVGAGAVVIKNINEQGTYVGIPAKEIKKGVLQYESANSGK